MTARTQFGIVVLAILLAVAVIRMGPNVRAHEESPGAIESYLHGLVDGGAITQAQHAQIETFAVQGPQLAARHMVDRPGDSRANLPRHAPVP